MKKPKRPVTAKSRKRRSRWLNWGAAVALVVVGASLDPAIIPPWGPLAAPPEQVGATFTRCGQGRPSTACVVDGDTLRLGTRSVRITGIDAPEIAKAKCPAERALGERSAQRLLQLVNGGEFEMVAHRFNMVDRFGRDLRVLRRGNASIGGTLRDEGLAHRYMGVKFSWC